MISLNMPDDIRNYVLKIQGERKAATGMGHYSQQQAIIHIIREHKDLMLQRNNKKKKNSNSTGHL